MTLQDIAKLLDGVRQTTQGFTACCPAHDDHDPSLSISTGEDGRILIHCFAGCSIHEVCDALAIPVRALFPHSTANPQIRKTQRHRKYNNAKQRSRQHLEGLRIDVLREAECLILTASGIAIRSWSAEQLDRELQRLARAYATIEGEDANGN